MTTRDAAQLDTSPYWADSASMPRFAKLDRGQRVDVVVSAAASPGSRPRIC